MAKGVSDFLALCSLLLLAGRGVSGEVNYAPQQPAYQLGIIVGHPAATPDKAVDGILTQNFAGGSCIHTTSLVDPVSVPYPPWWVVQLSRWIVPTAVTIYGRNDMAGTGSTRDTSESYHVGPFWNESLPRLVPNTLLSSDPLGSGRFFFLRSQGISLYYVAGNSQQFAIATRASGRYFAIKSSSINDPVDVCEVMVFGRANLLYGMNATERFGALPSGVNVSVLTDERESTCWNAFSPSSKYHFVLDLSNVVNLTTNFTVAVLTAGTVRPKTSDDGACAPGVYLTVATSDGRKCDFVQSVADGDRNYLSYACTCTACTGLGMRFVRKGSLTDSVSVCEIVAFNG